jgi:hypothetical protein
MSDKPTNRDRAQAIKNLPDGTDIRLHVRDGLWTGDLLIGGPYSGWITRYSDTPIGLISTLALVVQDHKKKLKQEAAKT